MGQEKQIKINPWVHLRGEINNQGRYLNATPVDRALLTKRVHWLIEDAVNIVQTHIAWYYEDSQS